ncbi:hypothetical protein [uncultured Lutibacter sp.]|uniref:hypothetical protein n=1 Tax=uncultured Lutibacter sp. TaxID=437739 RepID=UPI00262C2DD5|nr:hypothetical protein [uncultured Lutibacter sp.]
MKTQRQKFTNLKNSKVVKNIFKSVLGLLLMTIIVSCIDDPITEPYQQPQPNGLALAELFENNRINAVEEFTLDAATGGIITGSQGTKVTFPPNSFGINGTPVTGNVIIQMVEIYDKASMVLKNRSTLGEKPNGDKEALKSAGQFFVGAKQGANELELLEMATITSKDVNSDDVDWGMKVFKAGETLESTEDWVEADEDNNGEQDDVNFKEAEGTTGVIVTYNFGIGSFGWSNLDRWYSFAGPKTQLFVDVPEGYNGDNCAVYLYYDGENTAVARMDTWSETEQMFTEHYGLIPIGLEVHIIMVAEIEGELHYAMQGTTIVDNHIEVISSLSPITQPALESLINALP